MERKGSPKGAQNRGNWVTIRAPCPEGLPERQIGAKAPQNGAQRGPNGAQSAPKGCQKGAQRGSNRDPKSMIFEGFWDRSCDESPMDFHSISNEFSMEFERIFNGFS